MSVEGIAVCGSVRGYLAHQYRGTVPCGMCTSAWRLFSPVTPAGGYHRRHISVPDTAATKRCPDCGRDLARHDWSDRQWVKPDGRCTHCARAASAARARDVRAAKAALVLL